MDSTGALKALMEAITGSYQSAANNEKGFADMLKERRSFVQGGENSLGDQVQNDLKNGVNRVSISPAVADTPFLSYHTDNANKTAQLTQQGMEFGRQKLDALSALSSLLNASSDRSLRQQEIGNTKAYQEGELGVAQRNAAREEGVANAMYGTNFGGDNSAGGNPSANNTVIDQTAMNIASGKQDPDSLNLPQAMKTKVIQRAYELGYDPAKDINTYLGQLKNSFFNNDSSGKKGSIAQGNDVGNTIQNDLGGALSWLTHGLYQTPRTQQVNNYSNLKQSLASNLQSLLGRDHKLSPKLIQQLSSSLPEVGDTADEAGKKFKQIQDLINATYYQGGQPASNNDPLGILSK